MQYAMQVFEDGDHDKFRVVDKDGDPWFVLSEVCAKLDIAQAASAARLLDDDEKGVLNMHTPGGVQKVTIINESGLNSLIFRSRKPEAKRFRKWVTAEVLPTIRKTGSYSAKPTVPAFIRRANENWNRVDVGYFSVINELYARLYGRFEMAGHIIADHSPNGTENRPDVSVGRLFATWLDKHNPTLVGAISYYMHKTDQWEGEARQYPNSMLHLYIEFVETIWIPNHAETYFKPRDPAALPYLQNLLPSADRAKPGMMKTPTTSSFKKSA